MSDIIKMLPEMLDFFSSSGASAEQIDEAEKKLELRFSDEYREYLLKFGFASADGHELTGICTSPRLNVVDVTITERVRNPNLEKKYYVIEQVNIDRIVIWQSNTGEIYQTTPNTQPLKLCNSLCEYLDLS